MFISKCYYNISLIQFLQNMLDNFKIITTSPSLPTNAVFKTNIPFWIKIICLWGNAVYFCRGNIQTKYKIFLEKLYYALWRSAVYFQMSYPPFKRAVPLLEKPIFLHNICGIIDIEYPFQKCNMLEIESIIKQRFFSISCHWTTEYCPVWQKKSSCEEMTFLNNWIIFIWHVYPLIRSTQSLFR